MLEPMAEKPATASRPGSSWKKAEDELLTQAVKQYGERDQWKAVALLVPGRSNKACRKRWLHSLSPNVKKTAWTPDEDKRLVDLYAVHGTKWSTIARGIPGRTDDACSKRYREALDPNLKKDEWTPDEDLKLYAAFSRLGVRWKEVGQELQRSGLACRNRWRLLERKLVFHESPKDIQMPNRTTDESQEAWPYYPPEAYVGLNSSGNYFRESTPADIPLATPEVAPFQFSSSSLSAALSDPPRIHRPLPPETPPNELETDYAGASSPETLSSISPSLFRNDFDEPMSLDDSPMLHQSPFIVSPNLHLNDGNKALAPMDMDTSLMFQLSAPSSTEFRSLPLQNTASKSPLVFTDNLPNSYLSLPRDPFSYDENSSTSSSPFQRVNSLSPSSSPCANSPLELPSTTDQPRFSLLFSSDFISSSTPRGYQRPFRSSGESRLSSVMPLSDDQSVKPYVCGHSLCWPAGENSSTSCFRTSKELFEHNKSAHRDNEDTDRIFRCGLDGCQKSWKSLNGLQYHLQVSTDHFRHALSSRFSAGGSSGTVSDPGQADCNRPHACHHLNCFKTYKHASGLRYHLKHGHPKKLPAQLTHVPPSLERELPARTRKMRPRTDAFESPQ
ncbi:hypothetical protein C8J56DRAFT_296019 [Mycena floridula]|nr:hypothetical protein C8J56DRAFT_296019 [Mycena floridula]